MIVETRSLESTYTTLAIPVRHGYGLGRKPKTIPRKNIRTNTNPPQREMHHAYNVRAAVIAVSVPHAGNSHLMEVVQE